MGGTWRHRETQLFFGYIATKLFSKIRLDITFTTEEYNKSIVEDPFGHRVHYRGI